MQHQPPIQSEIVRAGIVQTWTIPEIARLLHTGLTPADYEMLALVADQHHITIPQLMRRALGSEAGR